MPRLTLVRHGRPTVDSALPASEWELAANAVADIRALGPVGQAGAAWFSSPEPKALATARLLAPGPVTVMADLREAQRPASWFDDAAEFSAVVRQAFESPAVPAAPGWEPLVETRHRVVAAVRRLLDPERSSVLVGHGTAWTLLVAELTGADPDLDAWASMPMPAVAELEVAGDEARMVKAWRA